MFALGFNKKSSFFMLISLFPVSNIGQPAFPFGRRRWVMSFVDATSLYPSNTTDEFCLECLLLFRSLEVYFFTAASNTWGAFYGGVVLDSPSHFYITCANWVFDIFVDSQYFLKVLVEKYKIRRKMLSQDLLYSPCFLLTP